MVRIFFALVFLARHSFFSILGGTVCSNKAEDFLTYKAPEPERAAAKVAYAFILY